MRNLYLLLLLWCATTATGWGQSLADSVAVEGPDYIVRASLIHLLDIYTPGPHVNFEHRLKGNHYLRHELGWITDFGYGGDESLEDVQGFRVRTGYRRYADSPGQITRRWFREIALDYRRLDLRVRSNFQLGDLNVFDQIRPYDIEQHAITLNYIAGLSVPLGQAARWQLDLGLGLGVRFAHRTYSELPVGVAFNDTTIFPILLSSSVWEYGRRDGWSVGPSLPMIAALGYQF